MDRSLRIPLALAVLTLSLWTADASAADRVRFHVLTVEETRSARNVLSEAVVAGPQGTDFEIELRGGRFKMTARFLTDSVVSGVMAVKATLDTRRLYGYSERNLPLYEEDSQTHDLTMDLREQIILLPFGSPSSDERLTIEITPALVPPTDDAASASDLEIDILKRSPDGSVNIRAFLVPHRFLLEAVLVTDGVEIARGKGRCEIGDAGTVHLAASRPGFAGLDVTVGVRQVLRERPDDLVAFDYRTATDRGSGIVPLGTPIELEVSRPDIPQRSNHVLRLIVRPADSD